MENVKEIKVGDKVRFVDEAAHISYPEWYPPVGTIGVVKMVNRRHSILVQWPEKSTSRDDDWFCDVTWVELVTKGG